MKLIRILTLSGLLSAVFMSVIAQAQSSESAAAQVLAVVKKVTFESVRSAGSSDPWYECTVEVEARPGGAATAGEYIDAVRCTFYLSFMVKREGQEVLVFYRASAEAATLEGGSGRFYRFYLPPEVVKRDRISGDAVFYYAELEVGGKPQAGSKESLGSKIPNVQNFISRASTEVAKTEGVLVPQYLSPFELDSRRPMPGMVRREAR
jgi:hypothetical protein